MKYVQDFFNFMLGYEWWAFLGMCACVLVTVVLLFFGRKGDPTSGDEFQVSWDEADLTWSSPTSVTARYWFVLNTLRHSLHEQNQGTDAPKFRIVRGTTHGLRSEYDALDVSLNAIERDQKSSMPYRPNLTGFVLRDRDGFCQIAELDANTGLPKGIRLGTELKTSVVGLKKGEKLELIVLVDMSHRPDKFAAIAEVLPGALFECSIAKPKQAVQSKERK